MQGVGQVLVLAWEARAARAALMQPCPCFSAFPYPCQSRPLLLQHTTLLHWTLVGECGCGVQCQAWALCVRPCACMRRAVAWRVGSCRSLQACLPARMRWCCTQGQHPWLPMWSLALAAWPVLRWW